MTAALISSAAGARCKSYFYYLIFDSMVLFYLNCILFFKSTCFSQVFMSFICFYVAIFNDHHLVSLLYKFLSSGFKRSWRDTVVAFYHSQMLPHGIHFTSHNLPDVPKPTLLFWSFCREPGDNHQHKLAQTIGISMCQALMEYDEGNYNQAFGLLYPLRYHMVDIGGSDAQVKSTGKKIITQNGLHQL